MHIECFPCPRYWTLQETASEQSGAVPGLEVEVDRDGDVLTVRGALGNPVNQVPLRAVPASLTCSLQSLSVQSRVPTAGGAGRPFLAVQVTAVVQGPQSD